MSDGRPKPARLDEDRTATGKTILTAPVVGHNGRVPFPGPAATHVDTETGRRTPLEPMFEQVAEVQERAVVARDSAREGAIAAIREVERQLVETLDGENLRGLPNLGNQSDRFYALRVRSPASTASRPIGDESPLVLTKEGVLAVARWRYDGERDAVEAPAAKDEDFLIEDVEAVLRAVGWAVDGHVAALGRAAERFERIGALAARVLAEIGPGTRVPAAG